MAAVEWLAEQAWQRLNTTPGLTAYDGKVTTTPPGGYAIYYPTAGRHYGDRTGAVLSSARWGFRVVCAGFSRAQVLGTVKRVRERFAGYPLDPSPAADPLMEEELDAPLLPDVSVPNDTRFSQTLGFYLTTSRS